MRMIGDQIWRKQREQERRGRGATVTRLRQGGLVGAAVTRHRSGSWPGYNNRAH